MQSCRPAALNVGIVQGGACTLERMGPSQGAHDRLQECLRILSLCKVGSDAGGRPGLVHVGVWVAAL